MERVIIAVGVLRAEKFKRRRLERDGECEER